MENLEVKTRVGKAYRFNQNIRGSIHEHLIKELKRIAWEAGIKTWKPAAVEILEPVLRKTGCCNDELEVTAVYHREDSDKKPNKIKKAIVPDNTRKAVDE